MVVSYFYTRYILWIPVVFQYILKLDGALCETFVLLQGLSCFKPIAFVRGCIEAYMYVCITFGFVRFLMDYSSNFAKTLHVFLCHCSNIQVKLSINYCNVNRLSDIETQGSTSCHISKIALNVHSVWIMRFCLHLSQNFQNRNICNLRFLSFASRKYSATG